jgi:hypothetical protein
VILLRARRVGPSLTAAISIAESTPPADAFVRGGQLVVQRVALLGSGGTQLLLVQDADGGLGARHGDLGVRPCNTLVAFNDWEFIAV